MRPAKQSGIDPLSEEDRCNMLTEHIPYRLSLFRDGLRPPWVPPCQHTNQAFEAGTVSGRILMSFLGLGYDEAKGCLKLEQKHKVTQGMTDDVKVTDVGGRFVELSELSEEESAILAGFYRGANKACAHFTLHSNHTGALQLSLGGIQQYRNYARKNQKAALATQRTSPRQVAGATSTKEAWDLLCKGTPVQPDQIALYIATDGPPRRQVEVAVELLSKHHDLHIGLIHVSKRGMEVIKRCP